MIKDSSGNLVKGSNSHGDRIRVRQVLGKYKIEKKIGEGGFANVFAAMDTIEGIRVALKIPHANYVTAELLDMFRQEVRTSAKLDHPNVLGVKDASVIDGRFVVVSLLGKQTLGDRLTKRMGIVKAFDYVDQMIAAVAYAHECGIVHCDIKPENFILFEEDRVRLADFGIAKVSRKTIEASGTGTVGHMAPEQAMGRPSFRSDVFSLGLIIYRMLSGYWPEYPFDWPPQGVSNMRRKRVHPDIISMIRKSIELRPKDRFADATKMAELYERLYPKALRYLDGKKIR